MKLDAKAAYPAAIKRPPGGPAFLSSIGAELLPLEPKDANLAIMTKHDQVFRSSHAKP